MCSARGHRNGKTRTSLSTTTMPRITGPLNFRSFWPRATWQRSPIPHTHPTWPPSDFFLFTKLKLRMKGRRFDSIEEIQEELQRVLDTFPKSGYLTHFQKGTSRDASKYGRNAGTAIFVQKGSTLKVMEEFNIQGKQTSFYKYCPWTFGYILVYLKSVCFTLYWETIIPCWEGAASIYTTVNTDKIVSTNLSNFVQYFTLWYDSLNSLENDFHRLFSISQQMDTKFHERLECYIKISLLFPINEFYSWPHTAKKKKMKRN